ncbi:otefin-like [Wyeomyia smithii]|uniref:otefin-like n=1 Tax=Wyeomyia smithii TaxID=174621 RepID=UPI00246820FE|nr:otefin-like [Wyeomyia smithii]
MSKLEDLTNDQLQKKLQEYGLANMPVTQTTRAVLIKRLKKKMEETDSKVRRETVHVVKYSSDEDSEMTEAGTEKKAQKKEPNRRATIGVSAAKLAKTLPVMPQLPPPKPVVDETPIEPSQKRRSGRITPIQQNNKDTAAAIPKEPMIVENSDDDEDLPLTQLSRRDRSSKSPSLSRGETVTTSYVHQVEIALKPPIPEVMEIDLTESVDDVQEEEMPEPEPYVRPVLTPSRETRFIGGNATTTSKRTTIAGTPGLSLNRPLPELSTSFGRPSMATSYNYNSTVREERKLDPTDSPYLSEFTKRLSRLKAETAQVNASREQPMRRTIAPSYVSAARSDGSSDYARLSTIRGRYDAKSASGKGGEIRASLRQVILSLDQKYPIKRIFYLLVVAMIVIFLFVFFFL